MMPSHTTRSVPGFNCQMDRNLLAQEIVTVPQGQHTDDRTERIALNDTALSTTVGADVQNATFQELERSVQTR